MIEGKWALPEEPGVGVSLDEEIVQTCLVTPPTVVA